MDSKESQKPGQQQAQDAARSQQQAQDAAKAQEAKVQDRLAESGQGVPRGGPEPIRGDKPSTGQQAERAKRSAFQANPDKQSLYDDAISNATRQLPHAATADEDTPFGALVKRITEEVVEYLVQLGSAKYAPNAASVEGNTREQVRSFVAERFQNHVDTLQKALTDLQRPA